MCHVVFFPRTLNNVQGIATSPFALVSMIFPMTVYVKMLRRELIQAESFDPLSVPWSHILCYFYFFIDVLVVLWRVVTALVSSHWQHYSGHLSSYWVSVVVWDGQGGLDYQDRYKTSTFGLRLILQHGDSIFWQFVAALVGCNNVNITVT